MTEPDNNTLGRETRTALFGEAGLAAGDRFLQRFDDGFARYLNDQLFGEVWNRPGLETKQRSMITIGVLIALARSDEIRLHMRGALNLGITEDELKEIIVHVGQYSGVPTAIEGIRAFNDVTNHTS